MQILILSYIVALVSIFGLITAIYVAANSTGKNNRTVGKNLKETPIPNIDASVLIHGGNDENQIEIGKRLEVIVTINFPDTEETAISIIDKFTVSLIDEKNPDGLIYSKDFDTKCGFSFKKDNLVVLLDEECDFTYKIDKQDLNKTVKAKVDFLNSEGEVISTIYSATGKTVIAAENKLSNTGTSVYSVISPILILVCGFFIVKSILKSIQRIIFNIIGISISLALFVSTIYNQLPLQIIIDSFFALIVVTALIFFPTTLRTSEYQ